MLLILLYTPWKLHIYLLLANVPFYDHIETTNQLTGFYMREIFVVKWLNHSWTSAIFFNEAVLQPTAQLMHPVDNPKLFGATFLQHVSIFASTISTFSNKISNFLKV